MYSLFYLFINSNTLYILVNNKICRGLIDTLRIDCGTRGTCRSHACVRNPFVTQDSLKREKKKGNENP